MDHSKTEVFIQINSWRHGTSANQEEEGVTSLPFLPSPKGKDGESEDGHTIVAAEWLQTTNTLRLNI